MIDKGPSAAKSWKSLAGNFGNGLGAGLCQERIHGEWTKNTRKQYTVNGPRKADHSLLSPLPIALQKGVHGNHLLRLL